MKREKNGRRQYKEYKQVLGQIGTEEVEEESQDRLSDGNWQGINKNVNHA